MTTDDLEKEIKELREQIDELKYKEGLESTRNDLKARLNKAEFRRKHKGILNFTGKIEKNTLGIFRGLGKTINKAAKGLEKSDEFIAKQQVKEREILKDKPKKNKIKDEMEWLD